MDIIIHGTKGGRKIFTPKKMSGLLDVTADSAKTSAIGKEAYAIRFTAENTIFSKYKIIRDVRGDKRTGFVGFSLFLTREEKLSGTDIITLLDKVSEEYCQKYIVNNNLDEVREDWALFERIADGYKTEPQFNNKMLSGSKDDAFVYFKDTDELNRYFDAPFQEEYGEYRQIFFIDKILEGSPENPLNALRHDANANLTERIDLENKYYYLINYDPDKKVSITADGKNRSKENNCIRANWQVEIRYLENDICNYFIPAKGKLSDPDSEIHQYLEIKDNNIFIKYKAFNNNLKPRTKTVHFKIIDYKGRPVNDAEITVKNDYPYQPVKVAKEAKDNEVTYTFEGKELGMDWTVSAKRCGDNVYSERLQFTPETQTLVLKEYKKVKIIAPDQENVNAMDCKIYIDDGYRYIDDSCYERNKDGIVFIDDAIDKTWNIQIKHKDYKYKNTEFRPRHDNIELEKRPQNINKQKIKDWSKKHRSKIIASSVVAVIALGFGILALRSSSGTDKPALIPKKKIMQYVENIELNKDTLEKFSKNWDKQKPIKKESDSWLSVFGIGSKKEKFDSTDYKSWNKVRLSIENAKSIRSCLINKADFTELKNLNYSTNQQKFKNAVDNIDSAKYEYVKTQLGNISSLNSLDLNQIADSINAILNPQTTTEKQSEQPKTEKKAETGDNSSQKPSQKSKESITPAPAPATPSENSTDTKIIEYLKGDELKIDSLLKCIELTQSEKLVNSIMLASGFRQKVEKTTILFDNFYNNKKNTGLLADVRKDDYLKKSKLRDLLEKICDDKGHFEKFQSISGRSSKSIKKLDEELEIKLKEQK
jgi:hypothetical protein